MSRRETGQRPSAGDPAPVVSLRSREQVVSFPRVHGQAPMTTLADSSRLLGESVRCVWRSRDHDGRSCGQRVPLEVMRAAWRRELSKGRRGGFFHFAWRGEVWLGYGTAGGDVRGVYCPRHRAEREQRLGYDPQPEA
ncbi:MAG TPA: hypothetical protein VMG62_01195 [Solirubrobacteraceae bacterium]|nr:hypothetical protein [Solirubrobacteraceae bacterium]